MSDLTVFSTLVAYCGVAAAAGFVDTLAGGGGLITVPALLLGGVPSLQALGTNKLQGVFRTFIASFGLFRNSRFNLSTLSLPFSASLFGGVLGSVLVQHINPSALDIVTPVVLVTIALYFLLVPKPGHMEKSPRVDGWAYTIVVLPLIGFYDGFFDPGTGSFYAPSGVSLRGWDLVRATASAKFFNLASSLASLAVFVYGGEVAWGIGIAMIGGQIVGARLGSFVVVSGGAKVIRPMIVAVSMVMLCRYVWQKGMWL